MRKVEFLDTSLRDGEQTPGVNFSIKEKIAIAKQLEKWGISAIEAGFPAASPDSFTAVQEIAKVLTYRRHSHISLFFFISSYVKIIYSVSFLTV